MYRASSVSGTKGQSLKITYILLNPNLNLPLILWANTS